MRRTKTFLNPVDRILYEEGFNEKIPEGYVEGIVEGYVEERTELMHKIIINMFKNNYTIKEISKDTGLSEEEILEYI